MMRYLLDTNIVSHVVRKHPQVLAHLIAVPIDRLYIPAITYAELTYGLAKHPEATRLHQLTHEFLSRVEILPFNEKVAAHYGVFRAMLEADGRNLSSLDMQIAAHAHYLHAILVSNDRAFRGITGLIVEDWLAMS